ncbi:hypothetical protein ACIPJK_31615 [Streptomyces roseus]|uniref:Rv1733c family protein n=1 Tax=Streptomyces roseus TaxID=66430 RepID=UPI00381B1C45
MHHRKKGAEANALRRPADSARTHVHVAFLLACLLAVVCGVLVGRVVWSDAGRASVETARHRHSTTATTTAATAYVAGVRMSSPPLTVAPATWQYPAHHAHTQTVPVPEGTRKGETVRVWVDDKGDAAPTPPGTSDVATTAVVYGTGTLCGVVFAAGALAFVRLRVVDARSARAWEAEWEDVEPLWTGRLRPGREAGDD